MLKKILIGALLMLPFGVNAACSKAIKLAIEQWPPYIYSNAQGQPAGLDVELLQAIFTEAGCTLIIGEELPRKRRLAMFTEGEIDLMLAASLTPERQVYSRFTQPYRNESVSLFSAPDKLKIHQDIASFDTILQRKITLLTPNAGWYGDDFQLVQPKLKNANLLSPFEAFSQGIKMFGAQRANLIMGDTGAIQYEAKLQKVNVSALPFIVASDPVHFMLSKKSTTDADVQVLNAAMDRLEKRGVLKRIRLRYGIQGEATAASVPASL